MNMLDKEDMKNDDDLQSQEFHHSMNDSELIKLHDRKPYTAYTQDLEFMWRWTIYQDKKLIQEGCSLTLDASRRSVEHVMAFYSMSDNLHKESGAIV